MDWPHGAAPGTRYWPLAPAFEGYGERLPTRREMLAADRRCCPERRLVRQTSVAYRTLNTLHSSRNFPHVASNSVAMSKCFVSSSLAANGRTETSVSAEEYTTPVLCRRIRVLGFYFFSKSLKSVIL
ncbi:unnamed protein product [Ixodes pacificus]